jgi:hypothetical protein
MYPQKLTSLQLTDSTRSCSLAKMMIIMEHEGQGSSRAHLRWQCVAEWFDLRFRDSLEIDIIIRNLAAGPSNSVPCIKV